MMRTKMFILTVVALGLLAGSVTLAFVFNGSKAHADVPPVANQEQAVEVAGCCVTGDCCCPGQGSCCDPAAKARAKTSTATRAASCCQTGNCCCPGQGSCCASASAASDTKACCSEKVEKKGNCCDK